MTRAVAASFGTARRTGQTSRLCVAVQLYNDAHSHPNQACMVTATAGEAADLKQEFGIPTKSITGGAQAFTGRRDLVYLVDNHVIQEMCYEAESADAEITRLGNVLNAKEAALDLARDAVDTVAYDNVYLQTLLDDAHVRLWNQARKGRYRNMRTMRRAR